MNNSNPENSYIAGLEASKQFAKRQLELSNTQAAQGANQAIMRGEIETLKQQVKDLQDVVVSLSKGPVHHQRQWWRIFYF